MDPPAEIGDILLVIDGQGFETRKPGFGVVASGLTLVVVHAAIVRLGLYEDAFGQTRLRWYSTAFAWWLPFCHESYWSRMM